MCKRLPRATRAFRLDTLALDSQAAHVTAGASAATETAILIEAFSLLVVVLVVAVRQVAELELVLHIIVVHQACAFAGAAAPPCPATVALQIQFLTSAQLHATAGGKAANGIAGDAVRSVVSVRVCAVGVLAREIQQVYAREDDQETAEQRDGVYGGGCVEALEEEA